MDAWSTYKESNVFFSPSDNLDQTVISDCIAFKGGNTRDAWKVLMTLAGKHKPKQIVLYLLFRNKPTALINVKISVVVLIHLTLLRN